ncbi:MAG TPA: chemotaxis protein CheW [Vicinamibacteria bacterium]|nr:chemotaxis protein CheW [Vicinamibacteria bacterium]
MTARRFDWDAARARLEAARRALEEGRTPEETRAVLERRARELARPRPEPPALTEWTDMLVFTAGGERYGVEVSRVVEVLPPASPTPLPGMRPLLAGVVSHRGRALAVVDLAGEGAGPGKPGEGEGRPIVVVEAEGADLGLLAEAVSGIARVPARAMAPGAAARPWIRGTTGDMTSVLDVDVLARHPRILVNEEAG